MKTLVLCPLQAELKVIRATLEREGFTSRTEEGRLSLCFFPELNLKLAVGGHGKTQFAVHTQFFLQSDPSFERVICMGCAGALAPEVQVGDVVVGEKTLEHDFLLKFILKPSPSFNGHRQTLDRLLQMEPSGFTIHAGVIASGDEDILERQRALQLYSQTKALAVAWEGAGGARACAFNQIPYLEVRGITDRADEEASQGFEKSFKAVMERLSFCLIALK